MASVGLAVGLELGGALAIEAARQGIKRMNRRAEDEDEADEIPLESIYEEEHSEESPEEHDNARRRQMTKFKRSLVRENPLMGLVKRSIRALTPTRARPVEAAVPQKTREVLTQELAELQAFVGVPQRVRVPNPPKEKPPNIPPPKTRVADLHKQVKEERRVLILKMEQELAEMEAVRKDLAAA